MGNCCGSLRERVTHSRSRRRLQGWKATGIVGLRDERLKGLPESLRDIASRLTAVDASVNQIRSLPSFLESFRQLQRLILTRNELITLPDSFAQLQELKVYFSLWKRVRVVGSLSRLEKLSMSSNCLTKIPEEMGQLTQLKEIDFSDNRISQLHCSFQGMVNLESLHLSNNNIQVHTLPSRIPEVSCICCDEVLPVTLRFCVRLKELHCDRNQIASVPSEILIECRSLQTFTLDGNPMDMDTFENTEGFKEFEKRRREKADKAISSQVMLGDGTLNEAISRRA